VQKRGTQSCLHYLYPQIFEEGYYEDSSTSMNTVKENSISMKMIKFAIPSLAFFIVTAGLLPARANGQQQPTTTDQDKTKVQGTDKGKTPVQGAAQGKAPAQGAQGTTPAAATQSKTPAQGTVQGAATPSTTQNKTPVQGTAQGNLPAQGTRQGIAPAQNTGQGNPQVQGNRQGMSPVQSFGQGNAQGRQGNAPQQNISQASPQAQGTRQDHAQPHNNWEAAPQELNAMQRQGFLDGIVGARKDMDNHRNPNVNNRDEYRHPSVPYKDQSAYRSGFERGYRTAMSNLTGQTVSAPVQSPRQEYTQSIHQEYGQEQQHNGQEQQHYGWETAPTDFSEVQRQGFLDGIAGARKDIYEHRTPNVVNHSEYLNPSVSWREKESYRVGYMRGFETATSRLSGNSNNDYRNNDYRQDSHQEYNQRHNDWEDAPSEFSEVQRQGFLDGIVGARKDMDNHRTPNVNNRDEYRSPNVPFRDRRAYRSGFERGYNTAMSRLSGGR
jgi:hypothetical protein